MKRTFAQLTTALMVFFISAIINAAPQTLILDNQHTYVLWTIEHLGFSSQAGKWYASGDVVLDQEHPDQSKVNVTINMNDINTGLPELDTHLKSPLFFNVKKFPKATFVSDKVTVLGKDSADVNGMLTLHGVTKPVMLHVTLNKVGVNPITDKRTVGFSATATIKRSDFGMNAFLPNLGDEVTLQIGAEAYLDKK